MNGTPLIDTRTVQANTTTQLFGGKLGATMVANMSVDTVTLSQTANGGGITLTGGQSLMWPANTSCFVQNGNASTVEIDYGENVQPGTTNVVTIDGPVTANLAAGTTVDANITNASIPVTGNVDANVTGTVDANITNATLDVSGTVDIGNAVSTTVTNDVTVTPSGTIDVQGVAGGTTIGVTGTVDIGSTADVNVTGGTIDATITSGTVNLASGTTVDANITNASIDVTGTVDVGNAISTTVTNDVTVTPSGTIDVQGVAGGTAIGVAGSVDIASGTVDIGNTPAVTVDSGTLEISAGTIDVQNTSGGFLLTGDAPAQALTVTNNSGSWTIDTVNPGYKALVILATGGFPAAGALITVTGNITGLTYASQIPCGVNLPAVVPIDPATDNAYQVVVATNLSTAPFNISNAWAFSQPPKFPLPAKRRATYNSENFAGGGATGVGNQGNVATEGAIARLHSWSCNIVNSNTTGGIIAAGIRIVDAYGENLTYYIAVGVSQNKTVTVDYGDEGLLLQTGSGAFALTVVNLSSTVAIPFVGVECTYSSM